jgi:hypothetical protein
LFDADLSGYSSFVSSVTGGSEIFGKTDGWMKFEKCSIVLMNNEFSD